MNVNDEQGLQSEVGENEGPYTKPQLWEKKVIQIQDLTALGAEVEEDGPVTLQSFNLIERLGKGSFGSVYLVEKKSNKKIYAMKVLEKEKVLK